jgi:transporter family-2 protein
MIDRHTALALTVVIGGLLAIQAPINSRLGTNIGGVQAAVVSFAVGTVLLVCLSFFFKGGLTTVGDFSLPWYYLAGGALGAIYVTTVLYTVRSLGAGGLAAATITGQLGASMVVDQFGLFGLERQPISIVRLAGVGLLLAGTFLVVTR